jgi:hypothetical protein
MKYYLFCYLLIILLGPKASAQKTDTLQAGKVLPRWENLKEHKARFTIFTTSKDGKLLHYGVQDRVVKPFPFNGKDCWISIQTSFNKDHITIDSTVFLEKTYMPVAYRTTIPGEELKEKVDFDGMKISAQIIYSDSVVSKDQSAPLPVYSVVMDQDILQALKFENGAKFVLKGINPGAHYRGLLTTSYEVIGDDNLVIGGTKINCWKLSTGKSVMWFSKQGQELLKQEFIFPNGNVFTKVRLL